MLKRSVILLSGLVAASLSFQAIAGNCAIPQGSTWEGVFNTTSKAKVFHHTYTTVCNYHDTFTITSTGDHPRVHVTGYLYDKPSGKGASYCHSVNFDTDLECNNTGFHLLDMYAGKRGDVYASAAGRHIGGKGSFGVKQGPIHATVNYDLEIDEK